MNILYYDHWYDQSIIKLETAKSLYSMLKEKIYENKNDVSPHDIVMLNQCILLIRSPIDYALRAVSIYYSGDTRVMLPVNNDKKRFIREFKKRTKCEDDKLCEHFWSLKDSSHDNSLWYKKLNTLSNDEKHNYIVKSIQRTKFTPIEYTDEIGIEYQSSLTIENTDLDSLISFYKDMFSVDMSNLKDQEYVEEIFFEYDDTEVFESLDYLSNLVLKFINYIYSIIK